MKRVIFLMMIFSAMMCFVPAQAQQNNRIPSKGYAVFKAKGNFQPYEFTRRSVGDKDILIEILYAGVCHSDVHKVRDDWDKETYPIVPGHEIAGRVVQVGKNVTKFKVGDYAGVGCWIGSCGECEYCKTGMEHLCSKRVLSFASTDYYHGNEQTYGGYSNNYVVSENFAIKIPANAQIEKVAPLLCAGITVYSPIRYSNVKKGDKVGVAGFGGLGHMAVKYAVALGAEVTVFDITEDKRQDALNMGARKYVNVNNPEELKELDNTLRVIINTIPANYDPLMYIKMLKLDGEMAILGLPPTKDIPNISTSWLPMNPLRKIYGSNTGSIHQIQEMINYSIANNIYPQVETITVKQIDQAYQNVINGKVKFRYVIDMKTLK
ncbi:MAG: putative formaldehyde dehydrogenase AdhA [Syntrophorhabdaceae bacterium PtaU1.Bin034]|nr:MAG: putative formaldehyde dehydrogenase AdhA [Syntrophorhabdaceae bacterium PtaU1.Bin034]